MKKTIALTHPKLKLERLVDSIKHDVNRYIKRERNKKLPGDADYWDFDCKYGATEETADEIHMAEINKCIDLLGDVGYKSIDSLHEVVCRSKTVRIELYVVKPSSTDGFLI